jgi:hypothetical protein
MVRSLAFVLLAPWGLAAHAGSGGDELSIHAKSLAAASAIAVAPVITKSTEAPFVGGHARDVMPELTLREELERRGPAGGCEVSATDLCYDLREARIVYKPARQYMPALPGLRAESISLRHDRVVLKYSFR